jgi:AraC-like DNA-binding protein
MNAESSWRGSVYLGVGRMMYAGPVGPTSLHAHHAFQVMRALAGRLQLRDVHGAAVEVDGAIVPPDQEHAFTGPAASAVLLYVEPESRTGQRLLAAYPRGGLADSWPCPRLARLALESPQEGAVNETIEAMLAAVVGPAEPSSLLHPALRRAVGVIAGRLDDRVRLDDVAAEVGLSRDRLSHLFAEQLGLGFRPYVLWKRLERAAHRLSFGENLTQAAHAAGFADASHMSRTFRRMFGIAPSDLAGWARFGLLDADVAS